MKMRDLEQATGVGREAIRFYIREGLLPEPRRPARNVADYCDDHVVRIRAIKRLQEERRLPLAEIREVLEGADPQAIAAGRGEEIAGLIAELLGEGRARPRAVDEVAESAGISVAEIRALAVRGIIGIDAGDRVDAADAGICTLWGRALQLGFRPEHGFDLDQLAETQAHVEAVAALQIERFMGDLGRRGTDADAAALGAEGLMLGRDLLGAMHLRAALRHLRDGDTGSEHGEGRGGH